MKTYVLIFGFANIVAGGPIYDSNKIKYLKERGWTVNVLPTDKGKIYIKPLEEYANLSFPFIKISPFLFTKSELKKKIDILASNITLSDEIVIETGTDYTAMWGELLAKRLNAKHIVIFLDEKNPKVNKYTANYYKFKYQRNELASISLKSMKYIFGSFIDLKKFENKILSATCSNVVANVDSNMLNEIKDSDYVIGSIGRLDKPFVPLIIDSICEFANTKKDSSIFVCLFGGAEDDIVSQVKRKLDKCSNIDYFVSGYIWPIPQSTFRKIDVFISAAGSARVSANQGVPTIKIDVINYRPEGILTDIKSFKCETLENKNANVIDYLNEILINNRKYKINGIIDLDKEWNDICMKFDKHMEFYSNSCLKKEYYRTNKIWDGTIRTLLKKIFFSFYDINKYYNLDVIKSEK